MTMERNAEVRRDLDVADKVVRACWDNFVATEPTYVLRDLIVIEIEKARTAARSAALEEAARKAEAMAAEFYQYRTERWISSGIAAAIRELKDK